MENFDLKGPHVSCLYYLYKCDGALTLKELCDICDEDKAYISRAIDTLENEGYVECESKTEKRYKSPLVLTKKGKDVAEKVARKVDQVVVTAGQGLTDENRKVFYQSLMLISDNLQKICDKYGD